MHRTPSTYDQNVTSEYCKFQKNLRQFSLMGGIGPSEFSDLIDQSMVDDLDYSISLGTGNCHQAAVHYSMETNNSNEVISLLLNEL